MESINPALLLLLCVRRNLEKGFSVKSGVLEYLKTEPSDFRAEVARWHNLLQRELATEGVIQQQISIYRQTLLQTLERGLAGEPVYNFLVELEVEIISACEHSIAESLGRLPFLLLVPLLFFQMPAFLLLLFGPILSRFLAAMGGN